MSDSESRLNSRYRYEVVGPSLRSTDRPPGTEVLRLKINFGGKIDRLLQSGFKMKELSDEDVSENDRLVERIRLKTGDVIGAITTLLS